MQRHDMIEAMRGLGLKGMAGAVEALDALGIDPQRRAETLGVAEFIALARVLS